MLLLGDHGHEPRHADAVRSHRRAHRLAVLVEHIDGERVGVLAAELEDVADLDATGGHQGAGTVRRRVAVADLCGLDGAVGDEVTTGDEPEDVLAVLVRAGDPCRSVDHARVDEVTDTVGLQRLRTDVALDEERVGGEIGLVEQRDLRRLERRLETLVVDLAVSRDTDSDQFPLSAGLPHLHEDVLEGFGRVDRRGRGSWCAASTSVPIVGVSGVSWTTASGSPSNGIGAGASVLTASTLAA